jgi:UDP-N-acetylmuramate--alanine ligase
MTIKLLTHSNNIFILGIKGVAMANLALILKKMGKNVVGSDVKEAFPTDRVLVNNKIAVIESFAPAALPKQIDLAIYSAAFGGIKHPQIKVLKARGVLIADQARIISELLDLGKNKIAVCGCHGKTTTASLLSYALIKLGKKPSYLVGAPNFNEFYGGDFQKTDYFVVEADEYAINPPINNTPKFLQLNPNSIICTNIDFDHPDVYLNLTSTQQAFLSFFQKVISCKKKLLVCHDDPNLMVLAEKMPRESYLSYGFNSHADLQIKNFSVRTKYSVFRLNYLGKDLGEFKLSLWGEKNASNAAAVIFQLFNLGFSSGEIKTAIKDFLGAKRRLELLFQNQNLSLFDDYAHHPSEIKATISALKSRFPARPIIIIFQPHTYSRTQALLKEFNEALNQADLSLILPIFSSARENSADFNISSLDIKGINNTDRLQVVANKQELLEKLPQFILPKSILVVMGAGDVYQLKNEIIKIIKTL